MANFSFSNSTAGGSGAGGSSQAGMGTVYKTLVATACSTFGLGTNGAMIRRGKIYDLLVGTNGTPADNYMEFAVNRIVTVTASQAIGVLSSLSSNACLDPADSTFAGLVWANSSAVSGSTDVWVTTVGNQPFYVGVNQRASYRWVASPGSEIVYPAVSSNGLSLGARSGSYTGTATGSVMISEQ